MNHLDCKQKFGFQKLLSSTIETVEEKERESEREPESAVGKNVTRVATKDGQKTDKEDKIVARDCEWLLFPSDAFFRQDKAIVRHAGLFFSFSSFFPNFEPGTVAAA